MFGLDWIFRNYNLNLFKLFCFNSIKYPVLPVNLNSVTRIALFVCDSGYWTSRLNLNETLPWENFNFNSYFFWRNFLCLFFQLYFRVKTIKYLDGKNCNRIKLFLFCSAITIDCLWKFIEIYLWKKSWEKKKKLISIIAIVFFPSCCGLPMFLLCAR